MKNKQKGFAVYLIIVIIFLFGIGGSLYYKSGISLDTDGMNLYPDKDITINKISKVEFENEKSTSDISGRNITNGFISKTTKFSDLKNSYLKIGNKEYITYPYSRDGNYLIFDYGVILRQKKDAYLGNIYYLDLRTETIKQLSDEIRAYEDAGIKIYQNNNLAAVVYVDRQYYIGDSGGNKDMKVVLFSKNGSKKVIAKFVNRSHENPVIIDGFLKGDNFYFQLNLSRQENASQGDLLKISDQYYVANILNYDFTDKDIFYDSKDVLTKRNVTDFKYQESMEICNSIKDSIDCEIDTAVKYNDEDFCKNLLDKGDQMLGQNARSCYSRMAIKKQNKDLCSKIPDFNNSEIYNLSIRERCVIEASDDLLVSDLNFCDTFKHPAVKEECILKKAVVNLDESICDKISQKYSITPQSCKAQVLEAVLIGNPTNNKAVSVAENVTQTKKQEYTLSNISNEDEAEKFLAQKIEEQKNLPKTDLVLCGKKYKIQTVPKMFDIDAFKRISEIANYDKSNNICLDMEKYYFGKELGVYTTSNENSFNVHFYELYDKKTLMTTSSVGANTKLGFAFITYWNSVSYFYPGLENGQARFVGIINGWLPNPNMNLITQEQKTEILNGIKTRTIKKEEDCYSEVYTKYILSSYPGDKELGNAIAKFCISKI